jgi:hypothetical protein
VYDRVMELTASKTAAWTMASAREALPGLFWWGPASRLSFFSASSAIAFHSRTGSAEGMQRSSSDSTARVLPIGASSVRKTVLGNRSGAAPDDTTAKDRRQRLSEPLSPPAALFLLPCPSPLL